MQVCKKMQVFLLTARPCKVINEVHRSNSASVSQGGREMTVIIVEEMQGLKSALIRFTGASAAAVDKTCLTGAIWDGMLALGTRSVSASFTGPNAHRKREVFDRLFGFLELEERDQLWELCNPTLRVADVTIRVVVRDDGERIVKMESYFD